jgi:hypothetical protein
MQLFLGVSTAGLMTIFYHLKFETPPPWMSRPLYLYPQEQGGPVIPPGTEISPSSSLSARLTGSSYTASEMAQQKTLFFQLHCCSHAATGVDCTENAASNSSVV